MMMMKHLFLITRRGEACTADEIIAQPVKMVLVKL